MKRLAALFSAIIMVLLIAVPARAQSVQDFAFHDFFVRYELKNDTPGGRLKIREEMNLTFRGQNRGILRALPSKNQGKDLQLKVTGVIRDGKPERFTTYEDSNENTVIRVGDPEVFITGNHTYVIEYEMSRAVILKFDGYDEWYWDINGTGWSQPFERVRGELILDESMLLNEPRHACYTGRQGATGSDCYVEKSGSTYTFGTTRRMDPGETLTVSAALQPVFEAYTFADFLRDNWLQILGVVPGLLLLVWAYMMWRRHGRDYAGRGTIVPQYGPPHGLSPTEAGLIADYTVQPRDLSATLIDLAVRKYLVIHDDTETMMKLFKVRNFSLELINNDFSGLKRHERELIAAFLPSQQVGDIVKIKDLNRSNMQIKVQAIIKDLQKSLEKDNGLIEPEGKRWSTIFIIAAFMCFFFASFLFGTPIGIGLAVGIVVAGIGMFVLAMFMPRRSHAGVEAYEYVKGLELYMKTAEADRLKMMQSVDSPYAEPSKTVDLFEKLLPYAVALGVEKSWAKQFDGVFTESPSWYRGSSVRNFHAASFASNLTGGLNSMNQSFARQSGSSSSGSGGGGSAGGGGGGGGGGGW